MAKRMVDTPEFPIIVKFDDGDKWILNNTEEIEYNLEWFDTEDDDDSATVVDNKDRPVRLKVKKLEILVFELK